MRLIGAQSMSRPREVWIYARVDRHPVALPHYRDPRLWQKLYVLESEAAAGEQVRGRTKAEARAESRDRKAVAEFKG